MSGQGVLGIHCSILRYVTQEGSTLFLRSSPTDMKSSIPPVWLGLGMGRSSETG